MEIGIWDILEYVAVALGIICVYLQTKEDIRAWPAGLLSVSLYVLIFFRSFLYSDMVLHFIYIALNAYGWWNWSKRQSGQPVVKITKMNKSSLLATTTLFLVATLIWGYLFDRFTDAQLVYFDAFTTVGSLIAQYLLVKKIIENWILWIIVDVVAINMYIYKGLYPTAFLFGVYLILCTMGFISWKKKMALQTSNTLP